MVDLESLIINSPMNTRRYFNYKKVVALSDDDFADFYLQIMNEYRDNKNWWSDKENTPHCSECSVIILEPKDLRMYYGKTLHPNCFRNFYEREGNEKGNIMKQYWDRVANLILE